MRTSAHTPARERRLRAVGLVVVALLCALVATEGQDGTGAGFTDRADTAVALSSDIPIDPLAISYPATTFTIDGGDQTLMPTVTGGNGPKSYAVSAGTLPPGVTLDSTTGALSAAGLVFPGSYAAAAPDALQADAADHAWAVAVLPDGKLLVGGAFTTIGGVPRNRLARLHADGSVDASFDPDVNGTVHAIAPQPDGSILVGGAFTQVGGVARNRLARLHADGSLDTGFDANVGDGIVYAIAVRPDGAIVVGGSFTTVGGTTRARLARVGPTGVLDPSWDPRMNNEVRVIHLAEDGSLVVGGAFTAAGSTTRNRIARFTPAGTLDPAWNPNANSWVLAIEPLPDGRLVVGGLFTTMGGANLPYVVRLETSGSPDPTFAPGLGGGGVRSLVIQPDGRILLGGDFTTAAGLTAGRMARVGSDGVVDPTFLPIFDNLVLDLALQPDGRPVAVGYFTLLGTTPRSRVARLGSLGGFPAPVTVSVTDFSGTAAVPVVLSTAMATPGAPTGLTASPGPGRISVSWTAPTDTGPGGVTDYRVEYSTGSDWRTLLRSPSGATTATITGLTAGVPVTVRVAAVGLGGRGAWSSTVQATPTAPLQVSYADATFDLGGPQSLAATVTGGGGPPTFSLAAGTLPPDVTLDPATGALSTTGIDHPASWAAGSVDPLYDPDLNSSVSVLATQPDGRLLVGGSLTTASGAARARLVRLLPDGAVEPGFAPVLNNVVSAIAVQSDGKILIGGSFTSVSGVARLRIARLHPDGSVDTSFDPNLNSTVSAIAVQPDGRILVGGAFTTVAGASQPYLVRLNADGTRDTSFDVVLNNAVSAIVVQPDGGIVVGGSFTTADGVNRNRILRLDSAGNLDLSWEPDANNLVSALALQPDGRIVLGGSFTSVGGVPRNRIARVNVNGTLDTTFNPNANNTVTALALTADGSIVAGGTFTTIGGSSRNRVALLSTSGVADPVWDPNAGGTVSAIAVQSDGRVVLGGAFTTMGGLTRNRIARIGTFTGYPAPVVVAATDGTDTAYAPLTLDVSATPPGAPTGLVAMSGGANMALSWDAPNSTGTGPITDYLVQYDDGTGWRGAVRTPSTATFVVVPGFTVGTTYTFRVAAVGLAGQGPWSSTTSITASSVQPLTLAYPDASLTPGASQSVYPTVSGGFGQRTFSVTGGTLPPGVTINPTTGAISTEGITHAGNYDDSALGMLFDPTASSTVTASVVLPDGRVVIGGAFTTIQGTGRNRIARLNPDGSLDPTFNPSAGGAVTSMALQPDGRLVVGGAFTAFTLPTTVTRNRLARFNADGSLDPTFTPNVANGQVSSVVVQPDGRILIGGTFTTVDGVPRNRLARLNADGTLDTTFDTAVGANSTVSSLALQRDGRILVAGAFTALNGGSRRYLGRLHADGSLDPTYNPNPSAAVNVVMLQADGRALIGGNFANVNGVVRSRVARIGSDGSLDTTFVDPVVSGTNGWVYALAETGDGRILVGGAFTSVGGVPRNRLARLNADGTLDPSFNPDANSTVWSITLGPDGRAIVGGDFTLLGGVARLRIARIGSFTGFPAVLGVTVADPTATAYATFTLTVGSTAPAAPTAVTATPRGGAVELSWTAPTTTGTGPVTDYRVQYDTGTGWTTFPRAASTATTALVRDLPAGVQTSFRVAAVTLAGAGAWSETVTATPLQPLSVAYPAANVPLGSPWTLTPVLSGGGAGVTAGLAEGALPASVNLDPASGALSSAALTHAADWRDGEVDRTLDLDVDNTVVATAVQADGRLLIGGTFATVAGQARTRVARLLPDGTLDATFVPATVNSNVTALAVQPDGRILIGGAFTSVGGVPRSGVARLNADGTLDTTFGNPNVGSVSALAVQADGRIVVVGTFTSAGGVARNRIARLNADGSLDTTFAPSASGAVSAVAIQPDGRILVGGSFLSVDGQTRPYLARLEPSGRLDQTYAPALNNVVNAIVAEPDGRALVGGSFSAVGTATRLRLARLNEDGTPHPTPNATFDSGSVNALAIRPDGRILVGGTFVSINGQPRVRIAQFAADGTLDPAFAPTASTTVSTLAVLPDGRVVAGGGFLDVSGSLRRYLVRLGTYGGLSGALPVRFADGDVQRTVPVRLMVGSPAGAPTGVAALPGGSGAVVSWTPPADTGGAPVTDYRIEVNDGSGWRAVLRQPSIATTARISGLTPAVPMSVRVLAVTAAGEGVRSSSVTVNAIAPLQVAYDDTSFDVATAQSLIPTVAGGAGPRSFAVTAGNLPPGVTLDPATGALSTGGIHPGGWSDTVVDLQLALEVGNTINAVAFQPDGKLLIGGTFAGVGGVARNRIARFNTDGTLDLTFDPNANGTVNTIVVQPDGRILVGGDFGTIAGGTSARLARLNADGTLDATLNVAANGAVNAIALQTDGAILVGGAFTTLGGQTRNRIGRILADGTVDLGFNPNASNVVSALAVQADGRILVGGSFSTIGGGTRGFVARLNSDGALDTTFNATANNAVLSIVPLADGRIVLGGHFTSIGGGTRNRIARLTSTGTNDPAFAAGTGANGQVSAVVVRPDGRIVLVGAFTQVEGLPRDRVAQLLADGTVDPSFVVPVDNSVSALSLSPSGRVAVGGTFTWLGGLRRTRVAVLGGYGFPAQVRITVTDDSGSVHVPLWLTLDGAIPATASSPVALGSTTTTTTTTSTVPASSTTTSTTTTSTTVPASSTTTSTTTSTTVPASTSTTSTTVPASTGG